MHDDNMPNKEESIYYWCFKNEISVFCPAFTDGALGDVMYFDSYREPGFICDINADLRRINDIAMKAKKSGQIIIGGGVIKHHINNANLMRNGADFSVLINTAQEFDGSDAGARPDEAIRSHFLGQDRDRSKVSESVRRSNAGASDFNWRDIR